MLSGTRKLWLVWRERAPSQSKIACARAATCVRSLSDVYSIASALTHGISSRHRRRGPGISR